MSPETVFDLVRETLWVAMQVAAPPLLAALAAGLAISILQALSQIQELTLTLLPKMAALFVTLLVAMPWLWQTMEAFTLRLFARIAEVGVG